MESLTPLLIELFARVPVQPTMQTRRSCVDSAIIVNPANQLTVSVEQAISGLIGRARAMMIDQGFAELLLSQGMRTMPRLLAAPPEEQMQYGKNFKPGILDFAIVCGFVSRLMAHAGIAARIHQTWPNGNEDDPTVGPGRRAAAARNGLGLAECGCRNSSTR